MNRIREIREQNKMTQSALAELLQVTQGTLSNWERGVHDPDSNSLLILAERFDTSIDYLLGRSDDPKPEDEAEIDRQLIAELKRLGVIRPDGTADRDMMKALEYLTKARQSILIEGSPEDK